MKKLLTLALALVFAVPAFATSRAKSQRNYSRAEFNTTMNFNKYRPELILDDCHREVYAFREKNARSCFEAYKIVANDDKDDKKGARLTACCNDVDKVENIRHETCERTVDLLIPTPEDFLTSGVAEDFLISSPVMIGVMTPGSPPVFLNIRMNFTQYEREIILANCKEEAGDLREEDVLLCNGAFANSEGDNRRGAKLTECYNDADELKFDRDAMCYSTVYPLQPLKVEPTPTSTPSSWESS
jgi:hypothetical protein